MNESIKNKVEILKASQLFASNIDDAPYTEMQSILLTLAGKKPVSEVTACKWIITPTSRHSEPADEDEVSDLFVSLGLFFYVYDNQCATSVAISTDKTLLDEHANNISSNSTLGKLFGYPETAVKAYGDNELMMGIEEQDELLESEGIPLFTPMFRFSKANFRQELETLKDWHMTLKEYNLV